MNTSGSNTPNPIFKKHTSSKEHIMANVTENSQAFVENQIIARALKDESFKQKLVSDPALAKSEIETQLGQKLAANFKVQVLQETADTAYIVLPHTVPSEGMTEDQLESVASGTWGVGFSTLSIPCQFGSATFTGGFDGHIGIG
jgi:hypothetical protein